MEGGEDAALLGFPFGRYAFRALTVERPSDRLRDTLLRHGYAWVRDHGPHGDECWVHGSMRAHAAARLGVDPGRPPCRGVAETETTRASSSSCRFSGP